MATDARAHKVPAGSDVFRRQNLLDLSLSVRDPIPVASASARASVLSALAALSPAITPSASNPIYFNQENLPLRHRTIFTVDGTNFISAAGWFVWEDSTARAAATGMVAGDRGYQRDTGAEYWYSGSAWSVLGSVNFPGRPVYVVGRSTSQSISNASTTAISLDAPSINTVGGYSAGSPTRFTPTLAGKYLVLGAAGFAANATGVRIAEIAKNGTAVAASQVSAASAGDTRMAVQPVVVDMNGSTDYIELRAYQSSGGSLGTTTGAGAFGMTIIYVGP